MERSIHKRVKSKFDQSEQRAYDSVIKNNPDVNQEQLVAKHSDKEFIWEVNENFESQSPTEESEFPIVSYPILEELSIVEATIQAKTDLKTFEGNLKALHNETHYRFTKVRQ